MKKLTRIDLSIGQSILISTLTIVTIVLAVTGLIFYTSFSIHTDALVESQSREINKQIVLNYESYINSIIEIANYIQSSSLNLDLKNSYESLQNIYVYNMESKKDVVSLALYDKNGVFLLGDLDRKVYDKQVILSFWFQNAMKDDAIFHFSPPHISGDDTRTQEEIISVSKVVDYFDGSVQKKGVLLLELNFRVIKELAGKTNLGPGGHILILNDDDSLIYSTVSGAPMAPESLELARAQYLGGFKADINSIGMYGNINTLSHTRWRIVTVTNIDDLNKAKSQMFLNLFLIMGSSLLITALVALFISRRISKPLNQLKKCMLRIESGDFYSRVEVTGQKEIVLVAKSFNDMIDEIRTLMDRLVSEQREKRKTELVALQNQINPHFLYNTLDSIVWLAENERSEDVVTTVVALARFFRISISKGKNFIAVKDEISHIRNYLTIQKIRYIGKFEYRFEIDKDIYNYKVMKLILQPLVENAIYHGVGEEEGTIIIRGYKKEQFLVFEVENSGYGIPKEKIEMLYQILNGTMDGHSVGLRNVYQRLKLYYGDKADLIISSELDEMTNVTLMIPSGLQNGDGQNE
ncbi:cache domain-containing sensor histidine kinase [Oceanispirochaeta crateris]|uniref:cache domain-containing sensor histidine kinase n=1 Tax=Oceanispirochaeta crateris TaxID=2518645 RepID=UPI00143D2B95|nr:sensor histidine kinase [Oceanispirochaeta crateris]